MNTNKKTTDRGDRVPARERLLAAAGSLFYEEDFNTVGIERVIERAGVAKASLYDCFGSKEELIRAYLMSRHDARVARLTEGLAKFETPRDRLLGIFDILADTCAEAGYRGCAFVKAGVNAGAESSAKAVCSESRAWMFDLWVRLSTEAGARDPVALARQMRMLYDGAAVAAQMDRDMGAAKSARAVAEALVDAATALPATRSRSSRVRA